MIVAERHLRDAIFQLQLLARVVASIAQLDALALRLNRLILMPYRLTTIIRLICMHALHISYRGHQLVD